MWRASRVSREGDLRGRRGERCRRDVAARRCIRPVKFDPTVGASCRAARYAQHNAEPGFSEAEAKPDRRVDVVAIEIAARQSAVDL
jgi:hypothetical protein